MSQKKGNRKPSEKLKKRFASKIIAGDFSGLQDFVRWQIKDVQKNTHTPWAELVQYPACIGMTAEDQYLPS